MALGLVPPSTVHPLVLMHCKVFRRFHILVVALAFIPEVQDDWAVGFMFVHWGTLDLIRYPFYILNMLRCCPYFLKWLRYSEFIVIYPVSFFSEMYLWALMLPYIYSKQLHALSPFPESLPYLAFNYFYFVIFYLCWRIYSFPQNYRKMLLLRLRKGLSDTARKESDSEKSE